MHTSSPRITLSLGRASDGPRTAGDIDLRGLSLALFLAWLFSAVLGPSQAPEDAPGMLLFGADVSTASLLAFLLASAAAMVAVGIIGPSVGISRRPFASSVAAASACGVGTACTAVGTAVIGLGWLALVGSAVSGLGAAVFVILWGRTYMGFKFPTIVINSSISFCIAYVLAVIITGWLPPIATAVVTIALPFCCIPAFYRASASESASAPSADLLEGSRSRNLMARCWVSSCLFGVAIGALRVICCEELPSAVSLTLDLVVFSGAVISVLVSLGALLLSKKETSWDHLFRALVPVIMLGIAIYGVSASTGYFPQFFLVISFVCIETLVWIFLSSMGNDIDASPERMFGMGYGLVQVGAIVGTVLYMLIVQDPQMYVDGLMGVIAGDIVEQTPAGAIVGSSVDTVLLDAVGHTFMMAAMALLLIVAIAFGNAVLPRYHEVKRLVTELLFPKLGAVMPAEGMGATSSMMDAVDDAPGSTIHGSRLSIGDTGTIEGITAEDARGSAAGSSEDDLEPGSEPSGDQGAAASVEADQDADPDDEKVSEDAEDAYEGEQGSQESNGSVKGRFKRRCDELGDTFLLSAREREVFALLAKGHNAAFITERLCISRSTAKTHINHIYKKMDIHTQQELLNMVEDRGKGPDGSGPSA